MIFPTTAAGLAAIFLPLLGYLRPTRSPYLVVALFSSAGLTALDFKYSAGTQREFWYFGAIPFMVVLTLLTLFSFFHEHEEVDDDEWESQESQLRFSQSICLSGALLCLVFGALRISTHPFPLLYHIHYASCIWQIFVFLLSPMLALGQANTNTKTNNIQISLITTLHLIATTACVHFMFSDRGLFVNNGLIQFFDVSALLFWTLWILCQLYWITKCIKTIGRLRLFKNCNYMPAPLH